MAGASDQKSFIDEASGRKAAIFARRSRISNTNDCPPAAQRRFKSTP